MPLIICLDTVTNEIADCTPSVFCIFHINWSMGAMAS